MSTICRVTIRRLPAALVLFATALLTACANMSSTTPTLSPATVAQMAPSGKLRVAINFGNPILATRDAATGEARGVSIDLARELAKRLGVPVELFT